MVEQLYENVKGNYAEAISRMRDDERILKYLKYFAMDESYNQLKNALDANNCEEAFKAAHTLKGVSQNMAFTDLATSVVEITEELRAGNLSGALQIFPDVQEKYKIVMDEINKVI